MISDTSIVIGSAGFFMGILIVVLIQIRRTLKRIEADRKRWTLEDEAYERKKAEK